MTTRTETLVSELRAATDAVLGTVEAYDPARWRRIVPDDGRSAAALACHIAVGYEHGMTWIQAMLAGEPLPTITPDGFDAENAADAARFADATMPETSALLREQGDALIALVTGFSDADLDRTSINDFFGAPGQVEQFVRITIGHTERHHAALTSAN